MQIKIPSILPCCRVKGLHARFPGENTRFAFSLAGNSLPGHLTVGPADPPRPVSTLSSNPQLQALDGLTGGVFTAPTSGERAARLRQWLDTDPAPERLQEVFKELSARDKGAARVLRERLDELRRARDQEAIAADWAARGQTLLEQVKLNIADAMAWQRDAAKAGAPLSREPP